MKHIVIIGGGTGASILLSGLRDFPVRISVIFSTADDGGSSGQLRRELQVLPPGDLRQGLLALSQTDPAFRRLLAYRFEQGFLKGHVVGNIALAALEKIFGAPEPAIAAATKILKVKGELAPVTLFPTTLSAVLENGRKIVGEHNLDEPRHDGNLRIKSLNLTPSSPANPRALRLLRQADAIVFGPGDLYTSILPNLLVKGIKPAIKKARGRKVLVTNLMTKYGQTNKFKASDFLYNLEKYLGKGIIDLMVVNTKKPSRPWLLRYRKRRSEFVGPDMAKLRSRGLSVAAAPLLSETIFAKSQADRLVRSYLRHDSRKLAKILYRVAN